MSASKSPGYNLEPHPLLAQLLSKGASANVFRGYVAASDRDDAIRLYPSLGNLSFYVEISRGDIVETAPAPTSLLPHNGTIVWVRSGAKVDYRGERSVSRVADGPTLKATSDHVDLVSGRLRMSVPVLRAGDDVCASCDPCSSCSGICQSGPAVIAR